jgi:transposase
MVAEIITTVERRRQWTTEEKLRIMSEALAPGVTIAAIADRNGVCRSLLYTWLRLAREDRLPGISITPPPAASFVPVRIEPPVVSQSTNRPFPSAPIAPEVRPPASSRRRMSVVEVTLGNGRTIKVEESIEPEALARLLTVIDGGRS